VNDFEDTGPLARAFGRFLNIVKLLIASLMMAAIVINFANVIARHVFSAPFIWAEEILIYIIVWMVFFGGAVVSWDGRQLRMDLLSSSLQGVPGKIVNGIAILILCILCVFMIIHSSEVIRTFVDTGQTSIATEVPMVVPHIAIPIGFTLILLGALIRFRKHLAGISTLPDTNSGAED